MAEAWRVARLRSKMNVLRLLPAAVVVLLFAPGPIALAAPKPTVAKQLVEAAKASESGDFPQAIAIYTEIWRADQKPEHLFLLARAEDQANQPEQALQHYRAFLASPGNASDLVAKARVFADQIDKKRLEDRVQQAYVDAYQRGQIQDAQLRAAERMRELTRLQEADNAARVGDGKTAAKLYLAAYQAARDRDDVILFKAAVAEQDAQQWQAAAGHLEEYVKRASPTAATYSEAVTRLEALHRRLGTAGAGAPPPKPVPKPAVVAEIPKDADPAAIGWTLVKIGAAVALVGAGSYVWTRMQQNDVEALLHVGANGKIVDISRAEAADRVQTVNTHVVTSIVLGGVGVAAAGVGAYFILRSPKRVALTPGPAPAGVGLAWRF